MPLLSAFFHLQNCFSVFRNLIFSQDIWGNVHYVSEINLISSGTLIKVFLSPGFVDERQLKTTIPK